MVIILGCVFIDVANILNQKDNITHYDWENKITFPLSQYELDNLIYTLSNQDLKFIVSNGDYEFSMSSFGLYLAESKGKQVISDVIEHVSINSLRFMLEQAKIKTYGWN